MLDTNFILQIGKEKVNHYKNINLDTLPNELQDPFLNWIQNDPDHSKENKFLEELKKISNEICSKNTIDDQKIAIKTAILNYVLNCSTLFFILLYPNEEDHNQLRFFPFTNISSDQLDNYLNYISSNDLYFKKEGITNEKTFLNAAIISQTYSISTLLYLTLEECALNIGIGNIKERVSAIRKNMANDILSSIQNSSNGNFIKLVTNAALEKQFIEEN